MWPKDSGSPLFMIPVSLMKANGSLFNLEKEGKLDVRILGEQVLDPSLGVKQIPALIQREIIILQISYR